LNNQKIPNFKVLVLVGAGHANVQVLKHLSMNKYNGLEVILVNDGFSAVYSGMTPGLIENYYKIEEAIIDLPKLCNNSRAILVNDSVTKLDENKNMVYLKEHPPIKFDLLSLNVGSQTKTDHLEISDYAKTINVKPISNLINQLNIIDQIISKKEIVNCSVVGGGIAAIEVSFAIKERFKEKININIISKKLLREKNIKNKTKKILEKFLKLKNIKIINENALSIDENYVISEKKDKILTDISIISSGVMSLPWIEESNINTDKNGFIRVNQTLQTENYKHIFAAGDICSLNFTDRPKSGVMAVRQGEVLKKNIFKFLLEQDLALFKPQSNWLYLIGTGNGNAIMNWKNISLSGHLIWKMKEFIDKKFMNKFKFLKPMSGKISSQTLKLDSKIQNQISINMKCEGCGSKLSKNLLVDYLEKNQSHNTKILSDSTSLKFPNNSITQSIDHIKYFKSMNPYIFGQIAYLHAQNDILASGNKVNSFSVSLGLPNNEKKSQKFFLEYFMEGILSESKKDGSIFASGHTYTSDEPGITINMNGLDFKNQSKADAKEGELIYLTKPLGIGYLMSAFMNNAEEISSFVYKKIINNMTQSNKNILEIINDNEVKILTDISGYGLASHLIDVCSSSNLSAYLDLKDDLLIMNNFEILLKYKSSAYDDNRTASENMIHFKNLITTQKKNIFPILYDPQTSGPLLLSVKEDQKEKFEKSFMTNYGFFPIKIGLFTERKDFSIIV